MTFETDMTHDLLMDKRECFNFNGIHFQREKPWSRENSGLSQQIIVIFSILFCIKVIIVKIYRI